MSSFDARHNTIRACVQQLCREHPAAKSDYRKLVQYYWYYIDGLKRFIPLEKLETITSPESITRAFRKLVEEGHITPPEKVVEKRRQEEWNYQRHYEIGVVG